MKAIQENMRRGLFLCIVVFLLAMVLLIPYEEDVTASDGIVYPSITCNGYVEKTTDPFSPGFYIYYGSVPDDHCLVGNDDDDFNEFWRGFTEWDISMIPIDADIVYVGYQMYCDGKPEDCQKFGIYMDIYQMENRPSTMEPGTETWESIYNDTHEGTCYVSDWAITLRTGYWPSESAFYNLGPAAAQDLEDQLSSGWFALGFSMYETTPSDEGIKFTDGVLKVVYGDIPINNPPTANDDSYSTIGDATLDIWAPGVLENDTDPDGDALIAENPTSPDYGTVILSPDGYMSYTPNTGFRGIDTFEYTASDGLGGTDTATVTITVNMTGLEMVLSRLDTIEAKVDEMSGGIDYLKEAVGKLDIQLTFQAPDKNQTVYHFGISYGGQPVLVSLCSVQGAFYNSTDGGWFEDNIDIEQDIDWWSWGAGHFRIKLDRPDHDECYLLLFVFEYFDGVTNRYGTCSVGNDNFKHWPKS